MKKKIFTVVISNLGLPITQISIDRVEASYLVDAPNAEELTKKISTITLAKKNIKDVKLIEPFPNSYTSISPYWRLHFFDPDKPLYWDLGARLNNSILIKPVFSGCI